MHDYAADAIYWVLLVVIIDHFDVSYKYNFSSMYHSVSGRQQLNHFTCIETACICCHIGVHVACITIYTTVITKQLILTSLFACSFKSKSAVSDYCVSTRVIHSTFTLWNLGIAINNINFDYNMSMQYI